MNLWAERSLNNWVESAFILKLDFMSKAVFFIFFSHEQNSSKADNVLKNNNLCNFSFIFCSLSF
jgi:hypothetical protein